MSFFKRIYSVVNQIPEGQVTTYGHIAASLGSKDARRIGHALHCNHNTSTPCHRVVFKDGSLSPSYVFGGENEQRYRLIQEGVTFNSSNQVNLHQHLYIPPNLTQPTLRIPKD